MNSSKYSWHDKSRRRKLQSSSCQAKRTAHFVSKRWDKKFPDQDHHLASLFRALLNDVGSPLACGLLSVLNYCEDWIDIVGSTYVDPHNYSDPVSFKADAQLVNFVKKLPGASESSRQAAYKSFIDAELQCAIANDKINRREHICDPRSGSIFMDAKRIMFEIIGEAPKVVDLDFQFGPGSTFSVSKNTDSIEKLSHGLDLTPGLRLSGVDFLESCPGWMSMHIDPLSSNFRDKINDALTFIPGDRLCTVPKTRKTDRPIAVGPTVNLLIQKGFGKVLRDRFRKHVNLDTANERHKKLARIGSIDGSIATIDLSSASDTISFMLIRDMLPESWFNALYECRSPRYLIEGKWYAYNKFSAMGNGYTFELESILFYALALATVRSNRASGPVSVFGDDIIIPTECYDDLVYVLAKAGFTVNCEKSFGSGSFRESCGGDYFAGINVRSFYLKRYICYQSLFLMSTWLQNGDKFLYPRLWKKVRHLIGTDVISVFSGRYNVDGCLYNPYTSLPPKYIVMSDPRFAEDSRPRPYSPERVNALYRQLHKAADPFCSPQTIPYLGRCVDKKRMRAVSGKRFRPWF